MVAVVYYYNFDFRFLPVSLKSYCLKKGLEW